MLSYKWAITFGHKSVPAGLNGDSGQHNEERKNVKGKVVEGRESSCPTNSRRDHKNLPRWDVRRFGESSCSYPRPTTYVSPKGLRQRYVAVTRGLQDLITSSIGKGLSDPERLMLETFHGREPVKQREVSPKILTDDGEKGVIAENNHSVKKVERVFLFNEDPQVKTLSQDADMGMVQGEISNLAVQENEEPMDLSILEETVGSLDKGKNPSSEEMDQFLGTNTQEDVSIMDTNEEMNNLGADGLREEEFDLSELHESLEENEADTAVQVEKEVIGKEVERKNKG